MAMETHVFFRGKLPSKAALNRAMKELGFPFAIKPATGSLERQSGFMPMTLWGEETGAEFDVYNDHSAVEEFAARGVDPSFERKASFRWGGNAEECAAGLCGTATLAKLVNGVVFDEAENRLLSVDDAIAVARKYLKTLPKPSKARRSHGPAALKRMLAPLLAKRSDLALAGQLLVIRPVRHLIRGVEFRWHSHRTVCTAAPYIRPLYQPSELFLEDAIFGSSLFSPDFEPKLFFRLAADAFAPLGQIATIEDFIESSWGKRLYSTDLLPSILLSRGLEQAKAYVAPSKRRAEVLAEAKARLARTDRGHKFEFEHRIMEVKQAEQALATAKSWEAFFARGDTAIFAHYRVWEAAVARGFKIEQVWEPSPFPVELPATDRVANSADPIFVPTPWLDFPDTWRQEAPDKPGEVRFGGDWERRDGRIMLLHPITREQAEANHRSYLGYELMTRLPEGQLLILAYNSDIVLETDGSFKEQERTPSVRYYLRIFDTHGRRMIADFREDSDDPGMLKMRSLDIRSVAGSGVWHSYLDFEHNEKLIHDDRPAERIFERRKMTDADRATYIFALPRFDEFESLWQRIAMHLSNEGYGAFT